MNAAQQTITIWYFSNPRVPPARLGSDPESKPNVTHERERDKLDRLRGHSPPLADCLVRFPTDSFGKPTVNYK
jgi:hypothetical protein